MICQNPNYGICKCQTDTVKRYARKLVSSLWIHSALELDTDVLSSDEVTIDMNNLKRFVFCTEG
jgi:hypothetical protein